MRHLTTRRRTGVLAGALAVGVALVAGPAVGFGGDTAQPPPGAKVPKTTDFVPGEAQPPAGTSVSKTTDFVPEAQPANTNPQPVSGFTSQVAPDEPASGAKPSKDGGVKGANSGGD